LRRIVLPALVAAWPGRAGADAFTEDVAALTRAPHRLSGTPEGAAAAAYIEQRLAAAGVETVLALDMPVLQTRTARCEVRVGDRVAALLPLRPNLTVPPVTPPEGFTGPLIYAGRGAPEEYGTRSPRGAIVALEAVAGVEWTRAFALGAQAVIFLGPEDDGGLPPPPLQVGLPVNLVRLYAPPAAQKALDLRRDYPQATVVSRVPWERNTGRNVLAFLPGTQPVFDATRGPETLVLAAHYDTFGEVPEAAPGARSAANVAALLDAAAWFRQHRPRRHVLCLFLDNQAQYHQGARVVYDALWTKTDEAERLAAEHAEEREAVAGLLEALQNDDPSIPGSPERRAAVLDVLRQQAAFAAGDLQRRLSELRVAVTQRPGPAPTDVTQTRTALTDRLADWDAARRAIHRGQPERIGTAVWDELREATRARLARRTRELELLARADTQCAAIRQALAGGWIALHVDINLSDTGPEWGVVVGDATHEGLWGSGSGSDQPGYYARILGAFRTAADAAFSGRAAPPAGADALALPPPSPATLLDPTRGRRFAPGRFASSGSVAGTYGIYNVSLMTGYDARPRDGQPADTLARLDVPAIHRFAAAAIRTLAALADTESLSLPRTFADLHLANRPRWRNGRSEGHFAGLSVSGSVAEDRPAEGALVAIWGFWPDPPRIWDVLTTVSALPDFDRFALAAVDANGRFAVEGVRNDLFRQAVTLGALFDAGGQLTAIGNADSLTTPGPLATLRVNLVRADSFPVPAPRLTDAAPASLRVMDADTDNPLPGSRSVTGQADELAFFSVAAGGAVTRVKVFQPGGPVLMNADGATPRGKGLALADWKTPPAVNGRTAEDLWQLNESRLRVLRERGVSGPDVEQLHGQALRALDQARAAPTVARREATLAKSMQLSRHVYPRLRLAMDDLVHAVVLLLLLTIPFAFVMERLVFCAAGIYTRLGGFALVFGVTFALLYAMHPGFAVAATPLIIFLAFAILLLSCLVIFILVRKFRDELQALQGQGGQVHAIEVSRLGTTLAAIGMGMSTMRRRPLRTALTAVTVILLTFTILCFASFNTRLGLRRTDAGLAPADTKAGILLHATDYGPLPAELAGAIRGLEGKEGLLAEQWWLTRRSVEDNPCSVARGEAPTGTGTVVWCDAVLGIQASELDRWPALAAVLPGPDAGARRAALERGDVFLTAALRDRLGVRPGDPLLLDGHRTRFAGLFDGPALQRLQQIDGRSVLPVDVVATAAMAGSEPTPAAKTADDRAQRDFARLSPDQVVLTGAVAVRERGGRLHLIALYPAAGAEPSDAAPRVAACAGIPVWARRASGVERLFFCEIADARGGLALLIPLFLGGFIVFGTLLGSIADREREIYTFSALGLAPVHIGFLFFAEAAVYAIIGGMGGQLLAQAVALGTGLVAKSGALAAPALNYSSDNALFANAVVMATVLLSAVYPAYRASRGANPGVPRAWRLPRPEGDVLSMTFPFTVSAYDMTGVLSFLAEHFRAHDDAGLGVFAASDVRLTPRGARGGPALCARLALAPFDLGVTQDFTLEAVASEIPGVDEVLIRATRRSGSGPDWWRANRVFVQDLRRQFLLWRTLSVDLIEAYRARTLQCLAERVEGEAS
jgi:hypothetical protein